MISIPIIFSTRSSPSMWHDSTPGIQSPMQPKSPATAHTSSAGRPMSISARALPIAPPLLRNVAACHGSPTIGPSGLQVEHPVGELFQLLGERHGRNDGPYHELGEPDVHEALDEPAQPVHAVGHEVAELHR